MRLQKREEGRRRRILAEKARRYWKEHRSSCRGRPSCRRPQPDTRHHWRRSRTTTGQIHHSHMFRHSDTTHLFHRFGTRRNNSPLPPACCTHRHHAWSNNRPGIPATDAWVGWRRNSTKGGRSPYRTCIGSPSFAPRGIVLDCYSFERLNSSRCQPALRKINLQTLSRKHRVDALCVW